MVFEDGQTAILATQFRHTEASSLQCANSKLTGLGLTSLWRDSELFYLQLTGFQLIQNVFFANTGQFYMILYMI